MTVAGARAAPSHRQQRRPGRRSAKPVVVARATLNVGGVTPDGGVELEPDVDVQDATPARRSDLHAARRQRRRDALVGLSVLAATLGTTVAVLDAFH